MATEKHEAVVVVMENLEVEVPVEEVVVVVIMIIMKKNEVPYKSFIHNSSDRHLELTE